MLGKQRFDFFVSTNSHWIAFRKLNIQISESKPCWVELTQKNLLEIDLVWFERMTKKTWSDLLACGQTLFSFFQSSEPTGYRKVGLTVITEPFLTIGGLGKMPFSSLPLWPLSIQVVSSFQMSQSKDKPIHKLSYLKMDAE